MARILVVHNFPTRFVKLDMQLLSHAHQVEELYYRSGQTSLPEIKHSVDHADVLLGWFASWHTFLPLLFSKLLKKPSILIIGGYDLANQPEIGYGHQRGGLRKWVSRLTMRLANRLVTNAEYSVQEAAVNAGIRSERITVLYHGVPDVTGNLPDHARQRLALSVGNVDKANLWRKGHEPFVRTAALLPDVQFVLAGAWRDNTIDTLKAIATPNVTFTGWIEDAKLDEYNRNASVYVQASSHEGFGMSLAEAMLAGCIPVATRAGAMPEVIGGEGFYLNTAEPEEIAVTVKQALEAPDQQRSRVRDRILNCFPLSNRQSGLEKIVSEVLRAHPATAN